MHIEISRKQYVLGLVVGAVVSAALSAAIVIAGLKAGITPGVSPLVVLFGWILFGRFLKNGLKGFLAITQVTGSAGAAVTAGVIFVAPITQILFKELGQPVPDVNIFELILASLSGSFLGWGFVGLATQRILADPRLPAPEAVACDELIHAASINPESRPPIGVSLIPGLAIGVFAACLIHLKKIQEVVYSLTFSIPQFLLPSSVTQPGNVSLTLVLSPLFFGIGALLTIPTGLLIFFGGFVNSITQGYASAMNMPGTTFRWVGGAAMVVAVVYSLIGYMIESKKQLKETSANMGSVDWSLLDIPTNVKYKLFGSILIGVALIFVMMAINGASLAGFLVIGIVATILVSLLSNLGGLLSLQVGSSASPVSGTVFVGMLVLSLSALAVGISGPEGIVFLVPIIVASCVAICAANDSSQDYKTVQLNGYFVANSFTGQIIGLIAGSVVVPAALWVAHNSYVLGSPNLPAPQASFFATVLKSLFLDSDIPWEPVGVGAVLGVIAVAVEIIGKKKGLILSSLAFAVGIYLPGVIGVGILMGALFKYFGTKSSTKASHTGILVAAGLITGDAFFALLMGAFIIAGVNLDEHAGTDPSYIWTLLLTALTLGLVWYNYNYKTKEN